MTSTQHYDIVATTHESPNNQPTPGQLAATVWRSRFGRPARLKPSLGDVDPTGSYCAVPEDWLQKKFGRLLFYVSFNYFWFWVIISVFGFGLCFGCGVLELD